MGTRKTKKIMETTKILSVREFKDYCAHHSYERIVYSSMNQEWYSAVHPCKLELSFEQILVWENPNLIYLKTGKERPFGEIKSEGMSIALVTHVQVEEVGAWGTVFTVVCQTTNTYAQSYVLIAKE
jgi:hypothetical protein